MRFFGDGIVVRRILGRGIATRRERAEADHLPLPSFPTPSTPAPMYSASATHFQASSAVTPSPCLARRQPLIPKEPVKPADRFGEVAGATAAACAAICCCCPCGLLNLVVAAAVKLPTGLLRQAVRRWRKRPAIVGDARKKAGPMVGALDDDEDDDFSIHGGNLLVSNSRGDAWPTKSPSPSPELLELEKEMWARFCSAGFWGSPSQREQGVIKV